ncbi:hypothetical protein Aasi_0787 [Candidatus Amoebophilus asiaticus 5a2]|uniref:Uncharacterized protein n=1 Tax=Amoebophilus asiaticus (strain 5a2) TaxID=452471 RepID=B3ESG3_AMOA5|nr:hypothetical protein [Candidatus Amoebophilus asiaticus]ACE06165.1 hypothetical protein Aasi_0787 [Candidatus Amoebophilus asiaticus 5a2]
MYSLEIGTGIPYASWNDKLLTTSNSSSKVSSQYKVSPNMRVGGTIGYEFGRMLAGAFCKWGPEIGLSYGFTRRVRLLDDRGLEEKYLHFPIVFKFLAFHIPKFKFQEDEEYEKMYYSSFGNIGLSIGYEFNILLSSVYKEKQSTIRLHPDSQLYYNSDGIKVVVPHSFGSIILKVFGYVYDSVYIGTAMRIPIELGYQSYSPEHVTKKKIFYNARAESTSCLELYMGLNISEWL